MLQFLNNGLLLVYFDSLSNSFILSVLNNIPSLTVTSGKKTLKVGETVVSAGTWMIVSIDSGEVLESNLPNIVSVLPQYLGRSTNDSLKLRGLKKTIQSLLYNLKNSDKEYFSSKEIIRTLQNMLNENNDKRLS